MNPFSSASSQRFFCMIRNQEAGPFDLIELAAELKYGHIDASTPIRNEESDDWLIFRDRPEFAAVQSIPIEEIARHLEEKERGGTSSQSSDEPRPFPWIIPIVALVISGLLLGAIVFYLVQEQPPTRVSHHGPQAVNKEK
jgi:hypothetical protein